MRVPGSNILKLALSVIGKQTVIYHRFSSRAPNDYGQYVAVYAPEQTICGSFQPVPRRLYKEAGLEWNKNYATFYAPADILDIQRDIIADQITFCGKIFQVLNNNDWFPIDGWAGVLVVQIAGENV